MHEPTDVDPPRPSPSRSSGLTLTGLLAGAALLASVVFGQLADPSPSLPPSDAVATAGEQHILLTPEQDTAIGVDSTRHCPVELGGLVLGEDHGVHGWALERWDCDALAGPWSIVIRAAGGQFGVRGAVVTFPVDSKGSGRAVTRPEGGMWNASLHRLVWPLARSHAQIVGDLGHSDLAALATQITVENGKPHVHVPRGLSVTAAVPYDQPLIHEMRYGASDLGHDADRGDGLVFTGITSGASLETFAFESGSTPAGLVHGKPAVLSSQSALVPNRPGGNGTLTWEVAPGVVAYVGYSGSTIQPSAVEVLRALANGSRLLTPGQWQAKDRLDLGGKSG
jgi:hypothetical protein